MVSFFNFLIRWSFYALFALVPIVFVGNTSELFEFNKMWLTFGLAIVIVGSWVGKMILEKRIFVQRTPLDIPLILFLLSQTISTIFSIDPHISLWGYYSRFNGGLLSWYCYALLYYAFVTNINVKNLFKYLYTTIAAGVFVALWGLPSHFGYDPTCLIFRGTFDVSCWTFAFQPKVRIFSTMGQPDWLAAYLVYLIPLSISLGIVLWKNKQKVWSWIFLAITLLFYLDLLYTRARSGMIGLIGALVISAGVALWIERKRFLHLLKTPQTLVKQYWYAWLVVLALAITTFTIGTPFDNLDKFTLTGIQSLFVHKSAQPAPPPAATKPTTTAIPTQEFGGTDSGKIRLFVWKGAWDIFLHNPLFGTGVETFAYAYYQYRPAGHNLTSEWDYLYNKAHNEYLNYLATTGGFGFLTYLLLIGASIWFMGKEIWVMSNRSLEDSKNKHENTQQLTIHNSSIIIGALLAGYISILITNFFGFSVVIMNIFLLITPAFALFLKDKMPQPMLSIPQRDKASSSTSEVQWIGIGIVFLICGYFIIVLIRFWLADVSYAYGQNLDHANEYQAAYSYLHDAVATRPSEPTFQDELTINDAVLAAALFAQKDTTNGSRLAQEAMQVSDTLVANYPHNVTFWKTRVRVFYTLSQIDPKYLLTALDAIQKAYALAPTDAKVAYNLGLLYGQTGNTEKGIETLEQTIKLKPDYRDAYYALGVFYHQAAIDASNKVVHPEFEVKAVDTMHFIESNFGKDPKIDELLKSWGEK